MAPPLNPRATRSNLVWIVGIAAGLIAGGIVAYGLTTLGTTTAAPARR